MADVITFDDLPQQIKSHYTQKRVKRVVKWIGIHGPTYFIANQWLYYDVWIATTDSPTQWVFSPGARFRHG